MHKEKSLSESEFIIDGEFDYDYYAKKVFDLNYGNAERFTYAFWNQLGDGKPINCAQRIVYYLINGKMPDPETPYQHLTLEDLEK